MKKTISSETPYIKKLYWDKVHEENYKDSEKIHEENYKYSDTINEENFK